VEPPVPFFILPKKRDEFDRNTKKMTEGDEGFEPLLVPEGSRLYLYCGSVSLLSCAERPARCVRLRPAAPLPAFLRHKDTNFLRNLSAQRGKRCGKTGKSGNLSRCRPDCHLERGLTPVIQIMGRGHDAKRLKNKPNRLTARIY